MKFVDKTGRCIPFTDMKSAIVDANSSFHCEQPNIDYGERLGRFEKSYCHGPFMSAADFENRSNAIMQKIHDSVQTRNLLKGVHLPICFPQIAVSNYGDIFARPFVASVGWAYATEFHKAWFSNQLNQLKMERLEIVKGSRHEQLLEAMDGHTVVATYFPNSMQGFSVPAAREMLKKLPDFLLLTGAIDTVAGMIGYADVLGRDDQTPWYDCAAVTWPFADYLYPSLRSEGKAGLVLFAVGSIVANDKHSGGLLVLG